jgi:predicted TIM-barrel fold metal-dependent hydrolase
VDRVVIDAHLHLWDTGRLRYESSPRVYEARDHPKPTFTLGPDA